MRKQRRVVAWPALDLARVNRQSNPFADLDVVARPEAIGFSESILVTPILKNDAKVRVSGLHAVDVGEAVLDFLLCSSFGGRAPQVLVRVAALVLAPHIEAAVNAWVALEDAGRLARLELGFTRSDLARRDIFDTGPRGTKGRR